MKIVAYNRYFENRHVKSQIGSGGVA